MGISLTGLTPATTYDALIKVGDNGPIDATLKVLSDGLGTNLPMEASTTGINFTGTTTVSGVAVANTTQLATKQDTLVSGTNIKTINSTSILGSGNIAVVTSPSGVSGAIQFSDGSAFASDATKFFWDNTNKRLGIGTNLPTQALDVVGQGRFSDNILFTTDAKFIGRDINSSSFRFTSSSSEIRANITTGGKFEVYNAGTGSNRFAVSSGGQTTISGGGSTSATTSLLVQNSAGVNAIKVTDDLVTEIGNQLNVVRTTFTAQLIEINANFATIAAGIRAGGNNKDFIISAKDSRDLYLSTTFASSITQVQFALKHNQGVLIKDDASTAIAASAKLEISSTTQGFLPPRMTTTQKNAIASPATGLVVYDSTTNKLQCYNGSTWNDLF
jgi:hypothetical protein